MPPPERRRSPRRSGCSTSRAQRADRAASAWSRTVRAAVQSIARRQSGAHLGPRRLRRRRGAQGFAARAPRDDLLRQRADRGGGRAQARGARAAACWCSDRIAAPRSSAARRSAFSNVVPRGDIGIIGASGTGIQEVSCLIARAGRGISHAIGTGGRDLKAEVGAITTLMAIDALDADAGTTHIVLISKPPAASVARLVLDRVAQSPKPFTICFSAAADLTLPKNARLAATLKGAAESAMGRSLAASRGDAGAGGARQARARPVRGRHAVRGGADRVRAGGACCVIQCSGARAPRSAPARAATS